ncbi:MAG: hypothetical protein ACREID_09830, partial [Planctomycetota bacterium]
RRVLVTVDGAPGGWRVTASDSRLRDRLLPPGGLSVLADALVGREFAEFPVVSVGPVVAEVVGRANWPVAGLALGAADFEATAPGRIAEPGLGRVLDSTKDEVHLVLIESAVIGLNVVDDLTNEPLSPTVTRRTEGVGEPLPVDVDGSFRVPADRRRHTLVFELPGYETASLELANMADQLVRGTASAYEVRMRRQADGAAGAFLLKLEPALAGRLALVGRDGRGGGWVRHVEQPDREGRWAAKAVPAGEWSVTVLASGKIPVTLPRVVVAPPAEETYEVRLSDGGGLSFKVADEEGNLLDGVRLRLVDSSGAQVDMQILTRVSDGSAFVSVNYIPSAASARADSGLAPGAYALTAASEGYLPATESFSIASTEVAEVSLRLRRR